jgi:hypothetical protein
MEVFILHLVYNNDSHDEKLGVLKKQSLHLPPMDRFGPAFVL